MADRPQVFISYHSQDRRSVLPIVEFLRAAGVDAWMDVQEISPGASWVKAIEGVLARSEVLIVFLGPPGLANYGEREIASAITAGKRCIPVVLPGGKVEGFLQQYASIDLTSDDDAVVLDQLQRLVEAAGGQPSRAVPGGLSTSTEKSLLNSLRGLIGLGPTPPTPATRAVPVEAPPSDDPVQLSRDIIRGRAADLKTTVWVVKELKKRKEMGLARQLLARVRADYTLSPSPAERLWLGQQHALCTYKDPHLPDDRKFDAALRILNDADDLLSTKTQETLGLAGAIHKYRWEALGQLPDLEQSAAYYLRGYKLGPEADFGYTSINAAYVLDLLANQAETLAQKAGAESTVAQERRAEAREIRAKLTQVLPPLSSQPGREFLEQQWWFLVTVAEAYFGLGQFNEAGAWLERAKKAGAEDWEFESTARQLASIARLLAGPAWLAQDPEQTPEWGTLSAFLGSVPAVRSAFIGRVGLALSGGGLRASLYHIGVLAKLAELDVLRHVEVLSCVSGGSIIGAHYYLELQNLLESKTDDDISREDYIAIVRRIERAFLEGAQKNVRTRVVSSLRTNLKMLAFRNYSRSDRIGELYESEFFSKVRDGKGEVPRCMHHLKVLPCGEQKGFSPRDHNWRRRSKVPILVLNATTLNTGHNWQFTATYMGEPPGAIDSEVDGNYRLRRMYYEEAPPAYRSVRLGRAVAASACVPGLFDPISMRALYPGLIVRLVDGGVHDNQGINALFEQSCSVMLVSDASGQMGTEDEPGNSALSALLRSNSVMGSRIRGAEFHDLEGRRRSSLLRGLMFIHLKKDLESDPENWVGCEDPVNALADEARPVFRRGELTTYGIRKDVQRLIADIRTDLDSFHEVEAFALMTSGYRMTETAFARTIVGFPKPSTFAPDWRFLSIEEPMKRTAGVDEAHAELKRLLAMSGANAFKVWRLIPWLFWTGSLLVAALVIGFFGFAFFGPKVELITLRTAAVALLASAVAGAVGKWPVAVFQYRSTIRRYIVSLSLCMAGWLVGGLHLLVFDPLYLRLGRAERLLSMMRLREKGG